MLACAVRASKVILTRTIFRLFSKHFWTTTCYCSRTKTLRAEQVGFSGLFGELEIHPSKEHRSSVQQEIYRRVSKLQVRVEHSIAGVKVFRSVRDIYRNFKAGFEDTLIETACGLHNLRSDFPIEAWLKAA